MLLRIHCEWHRKTKDLALLTWTQGSIGLQLGLEGSVIAPFCKGDLTYSTRDAIQGCKCSRATKTTVPWPLTPMPFGGSAKALGFGVWNLPGRIKKCRRPPECPVGRLLYLLVCPPRSPDIGRWMLWCCPLRGVQSGKINKFSEVRLLREPTRPRIGLSRTITPA